MQLGIDTDPAGVLRTSHSPNPLRTPAVHTFNRQVSDNTAKIIILKNNQMKISIKMLYRVWFSILNQQKDYP